MKVLVSLFALIFLGQAQAEEIPIAVGEWPPFAGEALPGKGAVLARMADTFAAAGMTVRYEFMPWNRALELTRAGKFAATPMWLRTPDRERDFILEGPVNNNVWVFFHRKDYPIEWEKLEDLSEVKIGITNGYSYGPEFDKILSLGTWRVDKGATDEFNLSKLAGGRIDAFPIDREVGDYLIATSDNNAIRGGVTFNPKAIHTQPGYLLISRKFPAGEAIARRFAAVWPKFRPAGFPEK